MSAYTPYRRLALPALARRATHSSPPTPGPVIMRGLVYGKAEHVLAFWFYDLMGGDFSPEDVRSTPRDEVRLAQHAPQHTAA